MHQTISRTRAALTSVIGRPLSDFHSLIKSNIWYLRSESARDPFRTSTRRNEIEISSARTFQNGVVGGPNIARNVLLIAFRILNRWLLRRVDDF